MADIAPQPDQIQLSLTLTLRPVTREDLPKLEMEGLFTKFRNIFRRAYQEMQRGQRLLLLAECNDAPVGRLFILFRSTDKSIANGKTRAYLYSFYVIPPFRGMGIGTRMVRYAEQILVERGYRFVTIAVAKDNARALQLYRRLDYYMLREDPGRWSYTDHKGRTRKMNEPCWILEKRLN